MTSRRLAPTPEKPAGSAFDSSEQNGTRPFDAAFGFDLLGFFGCETDAEDLGAALVGRQRGSSGAWHDTNIAGHRKFRKGVDRGDFRGYIKYMNTAAEMGLFNLFAGEPTTDEIAISDAENAAFRYTDARRVVTVAAYRLEHRCGRCCGTGRIAAYLHIEDGICFACGGEGVV